MNDRLPKMAAFAFAALVTWGALAILDTLAVDQHAATEMAKAASAPAHTADAKRPEPKS